MKSLLNTKVIYLSFLLILNSLLVLGQLPEDNDIKLAVGNKILVWEINGVKYGAAVPNEFVIPVQSETNKLQIGFIHSGYSHEDVDGKNALLTLSVVLKSPLLTDSDKDSIKRSNIILDNNILKVEITGQLSLRLKNDEIEQERLQKLQSFPRPLAANSIQPIQIKWSNVDGNTLFNYLSSADGLDIISILNLTLTATLTSKVCFVESNAETWWRRRSDNDIMIVKGGVDPLLLNLLSARVFTGCDEQLDKRQTDVLKKKLGAILKKQARGKYSLKKQDLFHTDWSNIISDTYNADYPNLYLKISPGKVLKENPTYVKDLSGASVNGIEALKSKP